MSPEEMSRQVGVFEIDKCISSRLWYTSLSVFQANGNSGSLREFNHNCSINLTELEAIVESLM